MNLLDKLNSGTFKKDINETDENNKDSIKNLFEKQKVFFEDLTEENSEPKKAFLYKYVSGDINETMSQDYKVEKINKLIKILNAIRDDDEIDVITKDYKYKEWHMLISEVILRDIEDRNGGLKKDDLYKIEDKEILLDLKEIITRVNKYLNFSTGNEIYTDENLGEVYLIEQNKENIKDYLFSTINRSNSDNIELKKGIFYSMLNGKFNSNLAYKPNSLQKVAIINEVVKILKEWKNDKARKNFNEPEYLEWKSIISETILRDIQDQWGGVMEKDFSKIDPEIKKEVCEIIKNKNSQMYESISYIK